MRVKQFIAWILLAVYLLAVGVPALCSLSCKCVSMRARSAQADHVCCCHCGCAQVNLDAADQLFATVAGADETIKAPCCGKHHSTEIDLYTGNSQDGERYIRLVILDLPATLIPENSDFIAEHFPCNRLARGAIPDLLQAHACSAALRAPPVLA